MMNVDKFVCSNYTNRAVGQVIVVEDTFRPRRHHRIFPLNATYCGPISLVSTGTTDMLGGKCCGLPNHESDI